MGQQTLQAIIAISGRVDNSFGQIGEALIGLGSQIDGISQKIIDFGKESVNIYRDYEDGILETRSTLSTLYSNSSDLDRAMDSLEDHAQKWAASTIFHTDDVADAMATAAHAGWNYDRIILGIPSSMLIAQAGSMELTQSVDYLAKMLASTNTDFQESERFIDQWARAADLVATDIPELGNAFIRLGSSAQFADSNAELFTMLAVLANVGTVGESAGTGVRNMMMRLIAPTQKAAEAMEGLGFSSDELEEAFEGVDAQSEAAYQRLAEYGFSAYDAQGNLKSFIDIFTDLNWALDQLPTEQEQNKILATIFPTRTLAYAKAMLNAVKDGSIYSIYEAIYGDSEGYTQEKSDILMSGLTGSMEILGSKWEELKRKTGETLAPDVESVADTLGGMIDKINDMDEGTFDALVSGVSVIAAAGPGLLLAGGAFRLIGYLLTPAGGIGLGLVALTAAAAAIKELEEADFANQFGDLKLDPSSFTEYIDSLGTSFETAYADVNEFSTALENAVTQYTTASETFKTNLITNMLTGATLTADDIATLEGLGDQMHAAIMSGIENNYAADMQTITNAFGGDELAQEDSTWSHIIQVLEIGFNNAVSRANELSQELREAMTSAFDDGTLTGDEIAGIQSIMDEMNEVMAMQTSADNYAAQQTLLRKAQTMGLDSLQELSDLEKERQDQVMESLYAAQDSAYGNLAATLDYQVAHGTVLEDGTVITREYADQLLADLKTRQASEASKYHENFIPFTMSLYEEAIGSSDLGDTWEGLRDFADSVLAKGTITESDYNAYQNGYGLTERNRVAELSEWYVDALGGYEQIMADVADLQATQGKTADKIAADTATANRLLQMLTMYDLSTVNGYGGLADTEQTTAYASVNGYSAEEARRQAESLDDSGMMELAWDYMRDAIERGYSFDFENLMSGNFTDTGYQSGLQSIVDRLKEVYDFGAIEIPKGLESIADYYAAYQLMYGDINPEDYLIGAVKTPEVTEYSAEIAKQTIAAVGGGMDAYLAEIGNGQDARDVNAAWSQMSREARTEYQNMVDALQEVYDFDRVLAGETNMFAEAGSAFRDDAAVYSLLYGNASHDLEKYKITAEIDPVLDEGAVQDAAGSQEIKVPVEPEVPEDTGELEMPSTVTGAAEAAQAAHSDAQSVMDDPLAQAVHVSDNGSAAATRGAIASTFSTPITQYINVVQRGGGGLMNRLAKYADGGRADEPSIFGEAGPEWAIPEEHSERTAWLLDAARQASGFTWPELLTRNGGLNAGGGNTPSQLIYSPTIIANDANGVEQRLIEDKARLEKWYQDKQLHDDVEVYA